MADSTDMPWIKQREFSFIMIGLNLIINFKTKFNIKWFDLEKNQFMAYNYEDPYMIKGLATDNQS